MWPWRLSSSGLRGAGWFISMARSSGLHGFGHDAGQHAARQRDLEIVVAAALRALQQVVGGRLGGIRHGTGGRALGILDAPGLVREAAAGKARAADGAARA